MTAAVPSNAYDSRRFVVWTYGLSWPPLALLVLDNRDVLALPGWLTASCGIGATLGPGLAALHLSRSRRPHGRRSLWRRALSSFNRPARWYVFAAGGPVALLVASAVLYRAFTGPLPTPAIGPALILYSALLLVEAFGEELGWRGFLLPKLRQTRSPAAASLIVGIVWALWHLPLFLTWGNVISHVPFPSYALLVIAGSFAFTWLHERTESVALAAVMHGALNIAATPFLVDADPAAIATLFTWFAAVVAVVSTLLTATGLPAPERAHTVT